MSLTGWLVCWLFGHSPGQRRERRKLHGVNVWHTLCGRCGHAEPLVKRTAQEHRLVVKVTQPNARVIRPSATVTPIRKGQR